MQSPFEFKKIVLRLPNWLGDAVMAAPTIELIARACPQAEIAIYGPSSTLQLFENHPQVSEFILQKSSSKSYLEAARIKKKRFDCAILLTNSFSSAWLFFRAGVPIRVGYRKDFRSWLLTHSLPSAKKTAGHHISKYQQLLKAIGISSNMALPTLFVSEKERQEAQEFINKTIDCPSPIIVGINPAAAYGSSKCWLVDRFEKLCEKLTDHPQVWVLVFGDAKAQELNEKIVNGKPKRINLANKTSIRSLMALIERCELMITNDSGPMHIACALQTPVVALFGSTSPEATGPYGSGVFIRKKVACSPCFKRECPIDFRCMKAITVDEVFQTAKDQIESIESRYAKT